MNLYLSIISLLIRIKKNGREILFCLQFHSFFILSDNSFASNGFTAIINSEYIDIEFTMVSIYFRLLKTNIRFLHDRLYSLCFGLEEQHHTFQEGYIQRKVVKKRVIWLYYASCNASLCFISCWMNILTVFQWIYILPK